MLKKKQSRSGKEGSGRSNHAGNHLILSLDTDTQIQIVYCTKYDISFCGLEKAHPFDAGKWGRVHSFLKDDQFFVDVRRDSVEPNEASNDDLSIAHSAKYLQSLNSSLNVAKIMEVPFVAAVPNFLVQRHALRNFRYQTGGTVAAAHLAVQHGWAINLGGGFHHCSASAGGGFCAYADISLAIKMLFAANLVPKVMIVDLDAHQGNGHARDFVDEKRVFVMDMYNADIYPNDTPAKRGISLSVELHSGCSSAHYTRLLHENLPSALDSFEPDFVLYNAGTDCLDGDALGRMCLSPQTVIDRDAFVFSECKRRAIPICMVTSGGYQMDNARIIADSVLNLRTMDLIPLPH